MRYEFKKELKEIFRGCEMKWRDFVAKIKFR